MEGARPFLGKIAQGAWREGLHPYQAGPAAPVGMIGISTSIA